MAPGYCTRTLRAKLLVGFTAGRREGHSGGVCSPHEKGRLAENPMTGEADARDTAVSRSLRYSTRSQTVFK